MFFWDITCLVVLYANKHIAVCSYGVHGAPVPLYVSTYLLR